ncbi:MAG TPA: PQQ-dependent sugar dehydrogenase, partial [Gammaproteobacteria bacterium]|nr:PQQ-dependent sugar dehydrogenase [Gammaproteobacteria bacterium]
MQHARIGRVSAAALLGFTIAAHAQPATWPLDPAKLPAASTSIPPGVGWPSPKLGEGPFMIESMRPEHRNLRVVVVARGLEQPWSIAFLPDGDMLVTERPGRLRLIHGGKLDPAPVQGVPKVYARGLQGLMDVVLHPKFADN